MGDLPRKCRVSLGFAPKDGERGAPVCVDRELSNVTLAETVGD